MSLPRQRHLLDCPVEIIDEMVLSMEKKDSVAFSSTCKLLRQVALRHILRSVCLKSNRQAKRFCKGIADKREWTQLVRSICLAISVDSSTSKSKKHLRTRKLAYALATNTPRHPDSNSLLAKALRGLPNLRTLVIHEAPRRCNMHDMLIHLTLPTLRSFSYTSSTILSRAPACDFVLRHPLLTDLSLRIRDRFEVSFASPTRNSVDDLESLAHLTSFDGPCFLVPELFIGNMPLITASIAWDSPCYDGAIVDEVLNLVAASSRQTLVDLNCSIFSWIPGFIQSIARALPNLQKLSISQQIPRPDPAIKAELIELLPKFRSLRSFSLNTTFPAGFGCRQEYADFFEDICEPLRAACPSLEMCDLYHAGKPEEEAPRVLELEPVDLTEIAQLLSA